MRTLTIEPFFNIISLSVQGQRNLPDVPDDFDLYRDDLLIFQ